MKELAEFMALGMRKAFDAIPAQVFVKDLESRFVMINKACEASWGLRQEDLYGRTGDRYFPPEQMQRILAEDRRARSCTTEIQSVENYWNVALQSQRTGHTFKQVLRDDEGHARYLMAVTLDMTERNEAQTRVEATTQALQALLMETRELSRRLLRAQEDERRSLALELHDELGQALTAIKIGLQSRNKVTADELIPHDARTLQTVEEAISKVRTMAVNLRPSILDDLGLHPALEWLVSQSHQPAGVKVVFRADTEVPRMDPDIEIAAFRVAQESITNALRHANAQQIVVQLWVTPRSLTLQITDDGIGFLPKAAQEHALRGNSLGQVGMQERAALVGGTLVVNSEPGAGCTVLLECALDSTKESMT